MKDVVVIGVAGGTGSGKSTLVKRLQEAFHNDDVATICHDFYYKAHPELTYEERTKLNYDHPDAFDTWLMVEHIKALKEGNTVECPTYSFVEHNRAEQTLKLIFGEKAEYEVSTNLRELDTGILTGQKVEDCKKIYGDDYLAARACWGFDRYGGDSAASITQRALRFLREVEQLPRDIERVAAFTHSGIIRALAANILQIPLSPVTPVKISNCCCAVLTFDGDRWRISKWNVCSATEGKPS